MVFYGPSGPPLSKTTKRGRKGGPPGGHSDDRWVYTPSPERSLNEPGDRRTEDRRTGFKETHGMDQRDTAPSPGVCVSRSSCRWSAFKFLCLRNTFLGPLPSSVVSCPGQERVPKGTRAGAALPSPSFGIPAGYVAARPWVAL